MWDALTTTGDDLKLLSALILEENDLGSRTAGQNRVMKKRDIEVKLNYGCSLDAIIDISNNFKHPICSSKSLSSEV